METRSEDRIRKLEQTNTHPLHEATLTQLERHARIEFDPRVVEAMRTAMKRKEAWLLFGTEKP
jgi:hypothetical protein